MSENFYVKQVRLERKTNEGKSVLPTWIDEKSAVLNKWVELKDVDDEDPKSGPWQVVEVHHDSRTHISYFRKFIEGQDRKTRKISDI